MLRAYAYDHDWDIAREYRMEGVSGRREAANTRAIELALSESAAFDVLLVVRLDRFTSQGIEVALRYVRQLQERGVHVVSIEDAGAEGAAGELILSMKGWLANQESVIRSERVKASVVLRAGIYLGGGRRSFGYQRDGTTINEVETEVVREAARRVIAGEPLRAIVRDFRDRDIKTEGGGLWSRSTVLTMLRGGRISGQYVHSDDIAGDAEWPAIISKADTLQLRRTLAASTTLDENAKKTWPRSRPKMLPSGGLHRCAKDGKAMQPWSVNRRGKTYRN